MTFTKEHQKMALFAMIAIIVLINSYYHVAGDQPKTAPLAFTRGMVASSPVRYGLQARGGKSDPLSVVTERSREPYPGVIRDIFRMERSAAHPRSKPTPTVVVIAPPSVPVLTPEEPDPFVFANPAQVCSIDHRGIYKREERDDRV